MDMTYPADDEYENNEPFSSPCSAPPLDPIPQEPAQAEQAPQPPAPASDTPANENIAPTPPLPKPDALQRNFERQAEDSFRMAVGSTAGTMTDFYSTTAEAYEGAAEAMRASAEGFASAMTQLNWKLFEFGRVNAQNNMNFVREVSGVRNIRDLVDVQTSFMRSQYDALTSQLRELQTLTTELTGKTAQSFQNQITRAS
jgi:hypothetical protein